VLDFGFAWEGLFGVSLLGAAVICILMYAGISIFHISVTAVLIGFRRRLVLFILPAVIAASPLAVVYAQRAILPRVSEFWRQGSSSRIGKAHSEEEIRQMNGWLSKVGHGTVFSLLVLTGLGAVASIALRRQSAGSREVSSLSSRSRSAPRQAKPPPPLTARRCAVWLGALWACLLLADIAAGALLGWSGRVYRTYEIAILLLPFLTLCANGIVFALLSVWSVRLSRVLAGEYAALMAVGLCVVQFIAAAVIYVLCFAAGYAAAGRF
jgi:hypothetical protein